MKLVLYQERTKRMLLIIGKSFIVSMKYYELCKFFQIFETMKKILVVLLLAATASGCKKTIEKIQQDLVIQAMTDGQWVITNFALNGNYITADFAAYKFKYYANKTVDAIKNGVIEKTGTWDGNASSMTTSANFTSPPYPLDLINGNWQITRNSWTFVEATQTSGGTTKQMRLDKL